MLSSLLRGGVGGREYLLLGAPYGEEALDRALLIEDLPLVSTNDPVSWSAGFPATSKDTDCLTTPAGFPPSVVCKSWVVTGTIMGVGALVLTTV